MAQAITSFMYSNNEGYWIDHGKKVPVTVPYIKKMVDEAWEAAPLCPAWGDQKNCAKRLLGSSYTESRLWYKAVSRKKGKTGHHSYGAYQVYAGMWLEDNGRVWKSFNKAMGYKPVKSPAILWDSSESARFAAWWTQISIDNDMDPYHFNRTTSAKKLYAIMLKVDNEDSYEDFY